MAQITLSILAKNTASQSISDLNKQIETFSTKLSSVKVNKDLTSQINALSKYYKSLASAVVKVNELEEKRKLIEEQLATQQAKTAKELEKVNTELIKQNDIIEKQKERQLIQAEKLSQKQVELAKKYESSNKATASSIETLKKGYADFIASLKTSKGMYEDGVFGSIEEDAKKSFESLQNLSKQFNNGDWGKEQSKALDSVRLSLKKYRAEVAIVKKENDKQPHPFTTTQAQQIPRLVKQYSTLLTIIKNLEKYYPKGTFDSFKNDLTSGQESLNLLNNEFKTTNTLTEDSQNRLNELSNSFNQISGAVSQTQSTLKSTKGTLIEIVEGFLKFQLSAMLVMKPLQLIRSALASINETLVKTEDAVIAVQRVLPSGSASDSEISTRLYKIAQEYGQTFENVQQIAQNFARTGMSWADTIKATEAAVLALNVAELDATQASDGMIAILTQFGLKASDLTLVVDKLNITADNAAVTTEKLLAALQRTGSAAANANLSLDETISLITALSEATGRSGENLGTALNSLIQYSSKASALDTFAGLSDNVAQVVGEYKKGAKDILDVWKAVSQEIESLDSRQADLLDNYFTTEDGSALKEALDGELQDIYTELGGVYDTANTFRKNYFIALLGNMDSVLNAEETLKKAQGYSQDENQKYLETYTAKLNSLKAQWEEIANDEQGLLGIKGTLVDIGSGLLTMVEWTGGLRTTFIAMGTALSSIFGAKVISGAVKAWKSFSDGVKTAFTNVKQLAKVEKTLSNVQELRKNSTELQLIADREAAIAQEKLLVLENLRNSGTATAVELEAAQTAVINANTIATNAQTSATNASAVATKAWGTAINTALGIIGIFTTVISLVVGFFQQLSQAQAENRKETIDTYKANEKTYTSLKALSKEYDELANKTNKTDEENKTFKDTEEKIVNLLQDKYHILTMLTKGTEDYTKAVQNLTKEELNQYNQELINAKLAAETNLKKANLGSAWVWGANNSTKYDSNSDSIKNILKDERIAVSDNVELYLDLKGGNDVQGKLKNYAEYKKAIEALTEARKKAILEGDYEKVALIENSDAWKDFNEIVNSSKQVIEDYLNTQTADALHNFELKFGEVKTTADFEKLTTWVQNQVNAGEYYNDTIQKILSGLVQIDKLEDNTTIFNSNNIEDVKNKYDGLIESLEKLRDLEKENNDLEEKKKEYLEAQDELLEKQNDLIKAQQALEDARNQATIRRFNSDTGQWEWQVDEKKIASAEENVAKAEENVKNQEESIEKAKENLEKEAYDTIIKQLTDETATNEGLNKLLDGLKTFLGDDFINKIKETIKNDVNVDLDKPINEKDSENNPDKNNKPKSEFELMKEAFKVIRNEDGTIATGKGINKDKLGDNGEVKWNGKNYKIENGGNVTDKNILKAVNDLGFADRTIFAYNGQIYGVLDDGVVKLQARASSYGDKSDKGYKALFDAVFSKEKSFDKGGIANGLGFLPKATARAETVNNPEITSKILSPVSNMQFDKFTRDLGIIFETSRQYAQSPVINKSVGNTDNSINNSGQVIIKDINLGADNRDSFIDVLGLYNIVPN